MINKTLNGLVAPTVHLGGSDGEQLQKTLNDAIGALNVAITETMECYPHGRDYYPQNDDAAYNTAREQHSERVKKLVSVQEELMEIMKNVRRQNNARGKGF